MLKRLKAWWAHFTRSAPPGYVWIRDPVKSIYLFDDHCAMATVKVDVNSWPDWRWCIELHSKKTIEGTESDRTAAEDACIWAAWKAGLLGWRGDMGIDKFLLSSKQG